MSLQGDSISAFLHRGGCSVSLGNSTARSPGSKGLRHGVQIQTPTRAKEAVWAGYAGGTWRRHKLCLSGRPLQAAAKPAIQKSWFAGAGFVNFQNKHEICVGCFFFCCFCFWKFLIFKSEKLILFLKKLNIMWAKQETLELRQLSICDL